MPLARGEANPSTCSESTRSASTSLASRARSSSVLPLLRAAGEPGAHAQRGEPALEPGGEVPAPARPRSARAGRRPGSSTVPRSSPPCAGVDDDALAEQRRAGGRRRRPGRAAAGGARRRPVGRAGAAPAACRVRRCRRRPARSRAGSCAARRRWTARRCRRRGRGDSRARCSWVCSAADVVAGERPPASWASTRSPSSPVRAGQRRVGLRPDGAVDRASRDAAGSAGRRARCSRRSRRRASGRCCPAGPTMASMRRTSATALPAAPRRRGCMMSRRVLVGRLQVRGAILPQRPRPARRPVSASRSARCPHGVFTVSVSGVLPDARTAATGAGGGRGARCAQPTKSVSSRRMAALGRAPTMVLTSSPPAEHGHRGDRHDLVAAARSAGSRRCSAWRS